MATMLIQATNIAFPREERGGDSRAMKRENKEFRFNFRVGLIF
jgi:hypothetical protein